MSTATETADEPTGRGPAWTAERGTSDEGRQGREAPQRRTEDTGEPASTERDRLARALRETRLQLAMTQSRLGALEQSATMELGRTLVRAARRPWPRGVQLPLELVRLWRDRGGLAGPGAATLALASAQLGDLAGGGERFLSALTAPGLGGPASATFTPPDLVITGVLTAQACATLAPDAAVLPLLPHDADVMLESAGADLVLIEAAAMMAGSAWAYAGDPAAVDRGRRLGRLIAAARALGKPVIFVRNVPAHLAPGLDWVAASCDAVCDDGFGVQLARFNPFGLDGSRLADPVYAGPRDPREPPAMRALLDAAAEAVPVTGPVRWQRRPALYREHAAFVTVAADQAREQLACGAHVILAGGGQVAGARVPAAGNAAALLEMVAAVRAEKPRPLDGIITGLRETFMAHATPARLMALARLAGLADTVVTGRQLAVLAQADDQAAAAGLCAQLSRQRLAPAEVVVVVEAADAESAEVAARAVTAALGELADRGTSIRPGPAIAGRGAAAVADRPGAGHCGRPDWMARAASRASSPWVAAWQAGREHDEAYLLDLACARECSQADVIGHADAAFTFTSSLEPELTRREYVTSGDTSHGLRLFSAGPVKEQSR
jgi:hypothetical protein